MKPTVNERLNQVLGIEAGEDKTALVPTTPAPIMSSGNPDKDMQDDFDIARNGLRSLIEKGTELVDDANFFAKEKQDAKTVEAAAMAQKEARDNLLALIELHRTRKEIERISEVSPAGGGDTTNNVNTAVFVGTTGELLKTIKDMNADGMLKQALKNVDLANAIDVKSTPVIEAAKIDA